MGRLFGILTNDTRKKIWYLPLMIEAQKEGWEVVTFTPHDVDFHNRVVHGWSWSLGKWERVNTPYPDLIHDVGYYHKGGFLIQLKKLRKVIPFTAHGTGGKWTIHKHLAMSSLLRPHLLPTYLLKNAHHVQDFLNVERIIILKPLNGKGGRGIYRVTRERDRYELIDPQGIHQTIDERKLIQLLENIRRAEPYLMQKWIDIRNHEGRPADVRLLVQKGEGGTWRLVGMAARKGGKAKITSNIVRGGEAIPIEAYLEEQFGREGKNQILSKLKSLAHIIPVELEKAYQRTFWEFGIDIGIDKEGHPWIFEVNIKPGTRTWELIGKPEVNRQGIKNVLAYVNYLVKKS